MIELLGVKSLNITVKEANELLIRYSELDTMTFDLVYNERYTEIGKGTINIQELIYMFNDKNTGSFATLNSNNTITIEVENMDSTYDCTIITENCKFKIKCFEYQTGEFKLEGC